MEQQRRRRASRLVVAVLTMAVTLGISVGVAGAEQTISSPGPLTNIRITDDLNCAVNHAADTAGEFFGETACATQIAVGGTVYGPANIPAGNSSTSTTAPA